MTTKFFNNQRVVLTRDLGNDLKAGMIGTTHIVQPLWSEFPFSNRFAVIEFDEIIGWHATRMLGMAKVLIEHFCVPVMDMPYDDELIYKQDPNREYWFVDEPKPSPDFDPANEDLSNPDLDETQKVEVVTDDAIAKWQQWELDNPDDEDGDAYELHPSECDECPSCGDDLVTSTTRDKNGNVVYTDVCSQCGYEHEEIEWHSYPYEVVSDDVIAQMQAKYPTADYPRRYGSLFVSINEYGKVKRGMVGKLYWSKESPKSSDGIEFVCEDGERQWYRWIWDDVVPYDPELVAENNKPA